MDMILERTIFIAHSSSRAECSQDAAEEKKNALYTRYRLNVIKFSLKRFTRSEFINTQIWQMHIL